MIGILLFNLVFRTFAADANLFIRSLMGSLSLPLGLTYITSSSLAGRGALTAVKPERRSPTDDEPGGDATPAGGAAPEPDEDADKPVVTSANESVPALHEAASLVPRPDDPEAAASASARVANVVAVDLPAENKRCSSGAAGEDGAENEGGGVVVGGRDLVSCSFRFLISLFWFSLVFVSFSTSLPRSPIVPVSCRIDSSDSRLILAHCSCQWAARSCAFWTSSCAFWTSFPLFRKENYPKNPPSQPWRPG